MRETGKEWTHKERERQREWGVIITEWVCDCCIYDVDVSWGSRTKPDGAMTTEQPAQTHKHTELHTVRSYWANHIITEQKERERVALTQLKTIISDPVLTSSEPRPSQAPLHLLWGIKINPRSLAHAWFTAAAAASLPELAPRVFYNVWVCTTHLFQHEAGFIQWKHWMHTSPQESTEPVRDVSQLKLHGIKVRTLAWCFSANWAQLYSFVNTI